MISDITKSLISLALKEDIGSGDVTTEALISKDSIVEAVLISRETLIVCGHDVAKCVCAEVDSALDYQILVRDGEHVQANATLARITGRGTSILVLERTLLNFFQRLSGIASVTAKYVEAVKGTTAKVVDTRKTTPGFREIDKYAVRVGGGTNHRFGLYDAVLIKNNHIDAIGGDVAKAVSIARNSAPEGMQVEVEVRNQKELEAALAASPDIILLDNMGTDELSKSVNLVRSNINYNRILLEASGGVTLETIRQIAETEVDWISVGALTHSVKASDISLRIR